AQLPVAPDNLFLWVCFGCFFSYTNHPLTHPIFHPQFNLELGKTKVN
ncbi:MAG: hypothetical protein ACI85U_004128, partial [Candidatus Promineifilaceae bacterium]